VVADLRLVDALQRIAKDDFSPEASAAPPPQSSGGTRQEDDGTDDARGKRLTWLLRLRWQSHARWLGLEETGDGIYRGEESAASLGESPV
jgi:hypothetical protein